MTDHGISVDRPVLPDSPTGAEEAALGRAVLVTVNVNDPAASGAMWEGPFEERLSDSPQAHPIARAWALWESIKDDFPTHSATVIANERARKLQAAYRTSALLGTDYATELADV